MSNTFFKFLIFACSVAFANPFQTEFFDPGFESLLISSWENPTLNDYNLIDTHNRDQKWKVIDTVPYNKPDDWDEDALNFFDWITYRLARAKLGADKGYVGQFMDFLGNDPNQREWCIITYGSVSRDPWDRNYPRGIQFMRDALLSYHFPGHFLYYLGGWPSLALGRLKYANVPYAFKPFLFEEARHLGYKKILWLDAAVIPLGDLTPIFQHIQSHGICFQSDKTPLLIGGVNDRFLDIYNHRGLKKGMALKQTTTQVVGIDTEHVDGNRLLNMWIQDATRRVPFLMSDQPPFIFLINQLNLTHAALPLHYSLEGRAGTGIYRMNRNSPLLYHHYDILNDQFPLPTNLIKVKR